MSKIKTLLLSCGILLSLSGVSTAGVISTIGEVAGAQLDVIGMTGYMTTGADMGGLSVTAQFAQGPDQSCVWAPSGPASGGCTVAGFFSITETGDTFTFPWTLTNLSTFDTLTLLTLDGTPGRLSDSGVVFDRTFGGGFGTFGSFRGHDADGTTSAAATGSALYSNLVALTGDPPVGDIFTTLDIRFADGLAPLEVAEFVADTDTIGIFFLPEPGTVTLMLLGLAGMAGVRRFRLGR